jgi:peptidyl-prolyl cis-trans isomerase SurA
MFTGTFFMKDLFGPGSDDEIVNPRDLANAVAVIGNKPLDTGLYRQALNQNMGRINLETTGGYISPELGELVQFNSFMQAVNNTVLLSGARAEKVKVSKRQLDQAIQGVLISMDFRNKKSLRRHLKESGIPYSAFKDSVRDMVLVRNFSDKIQKSVSVTDDDVENQFVEVNPRHILIRVTPEMDDSEREALAQFVYEKIESGLGFEEAVKQFSDDAGTKADGGNIGWIRLGQTVPEFEEVAFSVNVGEVARPIKSMFGYHIIQVLDKRNLEKPEDFDPEAAKEALLAQRQENSVQAYIQNYLMSHPLTINDPAIKAYKSKIEGDYGNAIAAYQLMVSQNPHAPLPHYFIGKVYMMLEETDNALKELKKADIKAGLNSQLSFPDLHLALADLYASKRDSKKMNDQFKKAVELSQDNETLLRQLLPVLLEKKSYTLRKEVEARIDEIEKEKEEKAKALQAQESDLPASLNALLEDAAELDISTENEGI